MKPFEIYELVHAIKQEEELCNRLLSIVSLPAVERNLALTKLGDALSQKGAPEHLAEILYQLRDDDLAIAVEKALKT